MQNDKVECRAFLHGLRCRQVKKLGAINNTSSAHEQQNWTLRAMLLIANVNNNNGNQ